MIKIIIWNSFTEFYSEITEGISKELKLSFYSVVHNDIGCSQMRLR